MVHHSVLASDAALPELAKAPPSHQPIAHGDHLGQAEHPIPTAHPMTQSLPNGCAHQVQTDLFTANSTKKGNFCSFTRNMHAHGMVSHAHIVSQLQAILS